MSLCHTIFMVALNQNKLTKNSTIHELVEMEWCL